MLVFTEDSWTEGELSFRPFAPVVYETLRIHDGVPLDFNAHMDRLKRSASFLGISDIDFKLIEKAIHDFPHHEGDYRFRIFLEIDGSTTLDAGPIPEHPGSVKVVLSRWRKIHPRSVPPNLKILNNPATILARLEKGKVYEAIMLNHEGFVAEGTFSNVFLVLRNTLVTPSLDTGILDGITRKRVIELSKELGVALEERLVTVMDLCRASEVFLTHTSMGIVPVRSLNQIELDAPGPITLKLMENFRRSIP